MPCYGKKPETLNSLLMADEARFQLPGFVNTQHERSPLNPQELHKPLYFLKVMVCYGIMVFGTVEPYFFVDNNGENEIPHSSPC